MSSTKSRFMSNTLRRITCKFHMTVEISDYTNYSSRCYSPRQIRRTLLHDL